MRKRPVSEYKANLQFRLRCWQLAISCWLLAGLVAGWIRHQRREGVVHYSAELHLSVILLDIFSKDFFNGPFQDLRIAVSCLRRVRRRFQ